MFDRGTYGLKWRDDRKATREGVLRKSFLRFGEYQDQTLWTILADEWLEAGPAGGAPGIH